MADIVSVTKITRGFFETLDRYTLLITDIGAVPPDYFEPGTVNLLRNKIKKDILNGETVPGCKLIRKGKS